MESFLIIACIALAAAWLGLTVAVRRSLRSIDVLEPLRNDEVGEAEGEIVLSVVVPARDEEKTLATGLDSIVRQRGVAFEVIVVNDHSTDRTGEIADDFARSDPRVRVIHDPDLPDGWLGKTNALQKGAAEARGRYILFTDADIVHGPTGFAAAIAEMERGELDLLTLMPATEWVTVFENAIVPGFFLGAIFLRISSVSDPDSPDAAAAGAFIMVRAKDYRALGRHEPLRDTVLDDVGLARLFKGSGRRVRLMGAPGLVYCRMYRGNREAFWAFTKNLLDAIPGKPWWFALVTWPFYGVLVAGGVACVVAGLALGSVPAVAAGLGVHLAQYATFYLMRGYMRFDPWRVLLFPVAAVSMSACLVRALYYRVVRGSVVWRGREVRIRNGRDGV